MISEITVKIALGPPAALAEISGGYTRAEDIPNPPIHLNQLPVLFMYHQFQMHLRNPEESLLIYPCRNWRKLNRKVEKSSLLRNFKALWMNRPALHQLAGSELSVI
jgi:hypothetical protein